MTDYVFALVFGAGIIVFFAWEQFNRPSYETSRELTRLVELLTPSRMRRRAVYWRAYAFYATMLLLIYATLCAYGLLLAPTLGLQIPGYTGSEAEVSVGASELPVAPALPSSGYDPQAIAMLPQQLTPAVEAAPADGGFTGDPTVPLFISLIMVGLAPSVPILVRIEEKIRFAAHRLSGIPTRLISGSRQLRRKALHLTAGPDTLMIPPQDWRRFEHYAEVSKRHLDDPDAFREDIAKILAFRAWILQEKLPLANPAARDNVSEIEAGIRKGVERLIFTLDALSGLEGVAASSVDGLAADQARLAWEAAATEADQQCGDLCALAMLYVEHSVLPTEEDAERLGWGGGAEGAGETDTSRQARLAERMLMSHVSDIARYLDRENISMVLWVRATAVALSVALVYGLVFGRDTAAAGSDSLAGGSRLLLGLLFLVSAALVYALALLVAISWRQSAYQSGSWRNVFVDHWSRWVPQLLTLLLLAGLASLACVVANNIYATILAPGVGLQKVLENWFAVLLGAVAYSGPQALLGALLALIVILVVDAWSSGAPGTRWLARLPVIGGVAMFFAGVGTRLMSSAAGATPSRPFDPFCRAARDPDFPFLPAFEGQTARDACVALWSPAFSAGILAGLIGLAVVLFIRGTLEHEFPRVKDDPSATPRRGAPTGAAPAAE